MAKTLAQLRAGARYLSDTVNSQLPLDAEINDRINEALLEAYDLVVGTYDHYYVSTMGPFTLGGAGANTKALPVNFYKDNGLDIDPGTSRARRVPRLGSFVERNNPRWLSYYITGQTITVAPPEISSGTYLFYFTPIGPQLAADSDTLDVVMNLLADFIQTRVAVGIKVRREQDTSELELTLSQHRQRAITMLSDRSEEAQQAPMAESRSIWWRIGDF